MARGCSWRRPRGPCRPAMASPGVQQGPHIEHNESQVRRDGGREGCNECVRGGGFHERLCLLFPLLSVCGGRVRKVEEWGRGLKGRARGGEGGRGRGKRGKGGGEWKQIAVGDVQANGCREAATQRGRSHGRRPGASSIVTSAAGGPECRPGGRASCLTSSPFPVRGPVP